MHVTNLTRKDLMIGTPAVLPVRREFIITRRAFAVVDVSLQHHDEGCALYARGRSLCLTVLALNKEAPACAGAKALLAESKRVISNGPLLAPHNRRSGS